MDTAILLDLQGVLDIVTVERDGILADGRREGELQQSDLILVEIHVGEHVLHHDVEDVARLEQVVDA